MLHVVNADVLIATRDLKDHKSFLSFYASCFMLHVVNAYVLIATRDLKDHNAF